jgi:hypothetical protein
MFYRSIFRSNTGAGLSAHSSGDTKAERAEYEIDRLHHDVERLLMITEALWQILKERLGYEDAELFRRVMEIDLRDGRADSRAPPSKPQPCPNCGRTTERNRPLCLYCGAARMTDVFGR